MDYKKTTEEYYSKWIGPDHIVHENREKVCFIYSSERNKMQHGYSAPFDLWIWRQPCQTIVSYGYKAASCIDLLKKALLFSADDQMVETEVVRLYGRPLLHSIKYVFEKALVHQTNARKLSTSDYSQYLALFRENNPNCGDTGWLKDYFDDITSLGLCFGVFDNGILASCTDAPGMPYMSEQVQEIGINTRQAYRQKGYAADACAACVNEILRCGKCPQWSTSIDNRASQKLAAKIGFIKLADVFTVTL